MQIIQVFVQLRTTARISCFLRPIRAKEFDDAKEGILEHGFGRALIQEVILEHFVFGARYFEQSSVSNLQVLKKRTFHDQLTRRLSCQRRRGQRLYRYLFKRNRCLHVRRYGSTRFVEIELQTLALSIAAIQTNFLPFLKAESQYWTSFTIISFL